MAAFVFAIRRMERNLKPRKMRKEKDKELDSEYKDGDDAGDIKNEEVK
jgi:hypothetical protein